MEIIKKELRTAPFFVSMFVSYSQKLPRRVTTKFLPGALMPEAKAL